jgi:hypothetical protein
MINLSYNSTKDRLDVNYTGVVTLEEIIDYIETVKNDKSLPRTLKILTIANNITMDFKTEDLAKIVYAVTESVKNYDFMIDAFIVDKSKETAFSLLFSNISTRDNYKFNVFSTEDAAQKWISSFNI